MVTLHRTARDKLEELFGGDVSFEEPLNRHCSLKIGGKSDIFLLARTSRHIQQALRFCHQQKLPYFIFGAGTNLLVPDEGYRGLVIKIGMSGIRFEGRTVIAEAGAGLQRLIKKSVEMNLTGVEFAWGIPGTIGGAVVMNAGACGHELSEIVTRVTGIDSDGNSFNMEHNELGFDYRSSNIRTRGFILCEIELMLKQADRDTVRARLAEIKRRRKDLNPKFPSAGCIFKNPAEESAGKLIDLCRLKGVEIGDAKVWDRHANFIINNGNASYCEVKDLMRLIAERVDRERGVRLEPEIIDMGQG